LQILLYEFGVMKLFGIVLLSLWSLSYAWHI